MADYKVVDGRLEKSETVVVKDTYDVADLKEKRAILVEEKTKAIAHFDEEIANIDVLLVEATKVGLK